MPSRRCSPVAASAAASSTTCACTGFLDMVVTTGSCSSEKDLLLSGESVILHRPLPMTTPSIQRYRCVPVLCPSEACSEHAQAGDDEKLRQAKRALRRIFFFMVRNLAASRAVWFAHTTPKLRCRVSGMAMPASLGYHGILALELVLAWVSFSPIFPLLAA